MKKTDFSLLSFIAAMIVLLSSCNNNSRTEQEWFKAGLNCMASGQYDRAITAFTNVLEINPDSARAYNARATAWTDKKNYDKAIEDFSKAISINPEMVTAYTGRALVWTYKNMPEKAIADYTTAIKINPDFAEAYKRRGTVYMLIGEFDKAIYPLWICHTHAPDTSQQRHSCHPSRPVAQARMSLYGYKQANQR